MPTITRFRFVLALLALVPLACFAQTATFTLPSQPLAESLKALGAQTNINVMVSPRLVDGKQAPALKATLSAKDALARLLEGTGLEYHFVNERTVVIREKAQAVAVDPAAASHANNANIPNTTKEAGKSSSQDFRVAQAAQEQTSNGTSLGGPDQSPKKSDDQNDQLQEVVVTGTLIHNSEPITPVLTITQADLIAQGYTSLAEAMFDLPQNFQGAGTSPSSNPVNDAGGQNAAFNTTYASGINLRGLGGGATLVLLNGRRLAPTAFGGTVDISQIPVSAVDRVEVLADGASALYGSDAVAGVVNIITKRDFSGVEVGGRTTGISEGKSPNYGGDLVGGQSWENGGFVASLDYEKENSLFARNRTFADTLPDPWALTPQNQAEHAYASLHQQFSDRLTLSMDTLFTHRDFETQNNLFANPTPYVASGTVNQYSVAPQLDYAISSDWSATLIGQWSSEQDHSLFVYSPPGAHTSSQPITYQTEYVEPRIDGKLFEMPGGAVRLALGGQVREDKLDYSQTNIRPGRPVSAAAFDASRHVTSAYAELMVPIVGADNALPFTRELRIDLSGRYDHYSDFGGTTNPKAGISWVPVNGVTLHGTFARSFQAPTLYELSTLNQEAGVAPYADPLSPTGQSLALGTYLTSPLQPETAKSVNLGLTFQPSFLAGLKVDASYFDVNFDNEIASPYAEGLCPAFTCSVQDQATLGSYFQKNPSLAEVNQILNNPAITIQNWAGGNFSPATYVPSDITAIATLGNINAASTRVRGIDLTSRYAGIDTAYGRFTASFDSSYYLRYDQRITSGSGAISIDNTAYNPLRFRAKANVGWEMTGWAVNARVNFANSYTNPQDTNCPGGCEISSWTTVDIGLSYTVPASFSETWLRDMRLAVAVDNLFNRDPPYVNTINSVGVNLGYDPVNANPLLRTIAITLTKRWGGEDSE